MRARNYSLRDAPDDSGRVVGQPEVIDRTTSANGKYEVKTGLSQGRASGPSALSTRRTEHRRENSVLIQQEKRSLQGAGRRFWLRRGPLKPGEEIFW